LKAKWQADLDERLKRALTTFAPPTKLKVSEWAEKYRIMNREETSKPGPWKNSTVPYLEKIMDAFNDDYIEFIAFIKAAQTGGTEAALNMTGYTIDQDPSRMMYVLPDEDTAKNFSTERLQKFLRCCSCLDHKFFDGDSKDTMLKFRGGFLILGSAQSPTKLSSWPIKRVIMDEVDKYPRWSGREASPLKLAEERTKTWPGRKIFLLSTPTLRTGNIMQAYDSSDVRYRYQVPCPFCGEFQTLEWKQVKFNSDDDLTIIQFNTYYECRFCGGHILDHHKPDMLIKGRWVAENAVLGKPKRVGFAINSLYSPWVSFGQMSTEFMRSKDDPKQLMNFVNSWLGEAWENKAAAMDIDVVLQRRTEIPMNMVPSWALILTGGVDCQQGYFYWSIRAWGTQMTSQLVAYGKAMTYEDITEIMDKFWPDEEGELRWQVNLYAIDSGYDTENVYQHCFENSDVAIPVKGSSNQMIARYKITALEKKEKQLIPQLLYILDTDQYKNMIAARLAKPIGKGSWMLNADTDEEYAEQITAEQRIIMDKGGRQIETWQKKTSAKQNHYLDTEVYSAFAADMLHVRNLEEEPVNETPYQPQKPAQEEAEYTPELPDLEL